MSTKIFNVYKFVGNGQTEPTLLDVFRFLQPIKKHIVTFYQDFAKTHRVVELHKKRCPDHGGSTPFNVDFDIEYRDSIDNVEENCVVYVHKTGLYIHFFVGWRFRDVFNKKVEKSKKLRDFHYQNQSDPPEDVPPKQWAMRAKILDEIIGHNTPAQSGFCYDFMSFNTFSMIVTRNAWQKG